MRRAAQAWLTTHSVPLNGRRALITGATGSLGACVARELARMGASVTLAVRNADKGAALAEELRRINPAGRYDVEPVDMRLLRSAEALAERMEADGRPIDLMILNAGIYRQKRETTADGVESTFAVNYLTPLYLILRLLPCIRAADAPRVVSVTSLAGLYARVDEADMQALRAKNLTEVYARTKRLILIAAFALSRRPEAAGVRFLPAHPGVSATNLFSLENAAYSARFLRFAVPVMRRIFMPPEEACLSLLSACIDEIPPGALTGPRGFLHAWGLPGASEPDRAARDAAYQDRLFAETLRLIPVEFRARIPEFFTAP